MKPFTEKVITIIQNIPAGKVMTYGQIASLAGSPRGARQVVRILHSLSEKHGLPWHRVLNVKGEIGFNDFAQSNEQRLNLECEGVTFIGPYSIDLEKHKYIPLSHF